MAARATQTDSEKELRDAFAVFDSDGSGTIEADEIRKVMKSLGDNLTDEEVEDMIRHVDKDGNGTIDCERDGVIAFVQVANVSRRGICGVHACE